MYVREKMMVWTIVCGQCGQRGPSAYYRMHTRMLAEEAGWKRAREDSEDRLCPDCQKAMREEAASLDAANLGLSNLELSNQAGG